MGRSLQGRGRMKRGICKECGKERNIANAKHQLCPIHNARRLAEGKPPKKYALKKRAYVKWKKQKPIKRTKIKVKDWKEDEMKVADNAFSKFILAKYGKNCYTCGNPAADCGHFISRRHMATRYDERNARPQCTYCNRFRHGRPELFRYKLIEEIGEKQVLMIEQEARNEIKLSSNQLEQVATIYNTMLAKL